MPTYEYACRSCGQHLEVVQSFKDDALTECPSCEGELRKVFSAAGIIFKGSGWHIKDYAGSSGGAAKSDTAKAETSGSGSSDGGSSTTSSPSSESGGSAKDTAKTDTSTSSTADAKSA